MAVANLAFIISGASLEVPIPKYVASAKVYLSCEACTSTALYSPCGKSAVISPFSSVVTMLYSFPSIISFVPTSSPLLFLAGTSVSSTL